MSNVLVIYRSVTSIFVNGCILSANPAAAVNTNGLAPIRSCFNKTLRHQSGSHERVCSDMLYEVSNRQIKPPTAGPKPVRSLQYHPDRTYEPAEAMADTSMAHFPRTCPGFSKIAFHLAAFSPFAQLTQHSGSSIKKKGGHILFSRLGRSVLIKEKNTRDPIEVRGEER